MRKFIAAGFAKNFTDFSDAWIIFHLEHKTLHFILRLEIFKALFCILVHGAELIDVEIFTVATNTLLLKDDWSGIFQED